VTSLPWRDLPWEIVWSREARTDLDRAPAQMQRRVVAALERYAGTGYGDVVRVQGTDQWRLRVGEWRVRFRTRIEARRVDDESGEAREISVRAVEVVVMRPRGSAYRE
jgi:mRNA-degrading endonuclease RelE of RelBE toxin-antitoxin system